MKAILFIGRRIACILICLFTCAITYSQELMKGDTMPDLQLSNVVNPSTEGLKLSSLNKRLVIIQFWNTKCGASLKSLKTIDSLQKRFNKDLQFVLVSKESKQQLSDFFKSHRKIKQPNVPMIAGDEELKKFFPHQYVPYHVWLQNGIKVFATTSAYNSTAENIGSYLAGNMIQLPQPTKSVKAPFNKPLINFYPDTARQVFFSYLIPAVDSIDGAQGRQKLLGSKVFNRIYLNKASVFDLYLAAFNAGGQRFQRSLNNVELHLNDSSKFIRPANTTFLDEWQSRNLYLYDLMVPPDQASQLYSVMKTDLERIFPLRAYVESRDGECLTLISTGETNVLLSKGGKPSISIRQKPSDSLWRFNNIPFKTFFMRFRNGLRHAGHEIVDGTDYHQNIDIILDANRIECAEIEALNNELKKYGLKMQRQHCTAEVLVIKDK